MADLGLGFELSDRAFAGSALDFEPEPVAGTDEGAVLERTDAADDTRLGHAVLGFEGLCCLDEGFEHEDTGQDGEGLEVVGEILLGHRDEFDRAEAFAVAFEDPVHELESHG